MSKTEWEKEGERTEREVARREREMDRARNQNNGRGRPQAARAHVRTVRAPSGGITIPTLWRGLLRGKRHFSAAPKEYRRRSIARVKFVANKQPGQWGAHGRYLAREGAQQEGGKGQGFDGQRQDIDMARTLDDWQMAGDPRIWKVILSPEDGSRLDLREHTRAVMQEFAAQWAAESGSRPDALEWVAIDHHNTENPHVHLALRGVTRDDQELVLSPVQLQKFREISAELSTRELGYRSEHEMQLSRDRDITRARWTRLDAEIEREVVQLRDGRMAVSISEPEIGGQQSARLSRLLSGHPLLGGSRQPMRPEQQRIARLQYLETLGVAEKIGARTWSLDPSWKGALKEMEVVRTRTQMLQEHRALLSDPRAVPVVTRLQPGDRLTGRVLGTTLDEQRDRLLLLLEGVDGRVHFLYENKALTTAREMGELRPETLVSLHCTESVSMEGKPYPRTTIEDFGLLPLLTKKDAQIPQAALEAEAQHAESTGTPPPLPQEGLAGFAALFRRQMAEYLERRAKRLQKEKADREKTAGEREQKPVEQNPGGQKSDMHGQGKPTPGDLGR